MNPRLAGLAYGAAWWGLRAVPAGVAGAAFRWGADRVRSRQLRANLARVVPAAALDAVAREGMRSYARYWCETFRLRSGDAARLLAGSHVTNRGPFDAALDAGRGTILALPHSGNWDAAGVWLVETLRRRGMTPTFTTVAQRLAPESVYRRFVTHRERLGFEVVAADDRGAHRALLARLRAGGVVCVLADRDITGTGIDVQFFGETARLPAGPARLAALTGATLLPTHLGFRPGGWTIAFADAISVPGPRDVAEATQGLADALAGLITSTPADWHMLAPVWAPEPTASAARGTGR